MISPTIGRVVLVHRPGMSDQAEPALVSYVWNDRLINVGGFDKNGFTFTLTSVRLLQDDEVASEGDTFAQWMPYQKGQAAKTEAAEAKVTPLDDIKRHALDFAVINARNTDQSIDAVVKMAEEFEKFLRAKA